MFNKETNRLLQCILDELKEIRDLNMRHYSFQQAAHNKSAAIYLKSRESDIKIIKEYDDL
jgi:hypothetical protein